MIPLSSEAQNLNEAFLPNQFSSSSDYERKSCFKPVKDKVYRSCASTINQRIFGTVFMALGCLTLYYLNQYNYTDGEYDDEEKRYTEGYYFTATVLSGLGGAFTTAGAEFMIQSKFTRLTRYITDLYLLTLLPIACYSLFQAELNDIRDDYTISKPDDYNRNWKWIFRLGGSYTIVCGAFLVRLTAQDNRRDLMEGEESLNGDDKISNSTVVILNELNHKRLDQDRVRPLLGSSDTRTDYKIWSVAIPAFIGGSALTVSILSNYIEDIRYKDFEIDGGNGLGYMMMVGGSLFTANSMANLFHYKLFRSIKKFDKRLLLDNRVEAYSCAHEAKVQLREGLNKAAIMWAFLFPFSVHNNLTNNITRFAAFFLFSYEGAYSEAEFRSGAQKVVPPPKSQEIIEACNLVPRRRKVICCTARLPSNKKEWKGFFYNNYEKMQRIIQGTFAFGVTTFFFANTIIAAEDRKDLKIVSAATGAISLPIWFVTKTVSDLTYDDKAGKFRSAVHYYLNHNLRSFLMIGLLINQIYGRINSHREDNSATFSDYVFTISAVFILTGPYAFSSAREALLINLINAAAKKMALGDP